MNVCPKGLMVSSSHQINPVKETSSRSDVAKNGPRTAALPFARLRSWTASWRQLNAPSGSTVSVLHPLHGAAEKYHIDNQHGPKEESQHWGYTTEMPMGTPSQICTISGFFTSSRSMAGRGQSFCVLDAL